MFCCFVFFFSGQRSAALWSAETKGLCWTPHVRLVSMTTVSWQPLLCDRHCPFAARYPFWFHLTSGHVKVFAGNWYDTWDKKWTLSPWPGKKNKSDSEITGAFLKSWDICNSNRSEGKHVQRRSARKKGKKKKRKKRWVLRPFLLAAACCSRRSSLRKKTLCGHRPKLRVVSVALRTGVSHFLFPFSYSKSE